MANIPQNSTYTSKTGADFSNYTPLDLSKYTSINNALNVPKRNQFQSGFKASKRYNLEDLKANAILPSTEGLTPGTPEYNAASRLYKIRYLEKKNLEKKYPELYKPKEEEAIDMRENIRLSSDYGTFQDDQEYDYGDNKLSWGTPDEPVLKNMVQYDSEGNKIVGQYIQDLADKNKLVKTNRGTDLLQNDAFRGGIPGFMGTIDHIMPLTLGGADTIKNKELLSPEDNYRKTKSQAIAYTLYAYGDISINEARIMALQWRNPDVSDVPKPDNYGLVSSLENGKTGIEIAREAKKGWYDAKPVTAKQVIAGIPEVAATLGDYRPLVEKGYLPESVLPYTDTIAEFVKGFESEATLGFVPYIPRDDSTSTKIAGTIGRAAGFFTPFGFTGRILKYGTKGTKGVYGLAKGSKILKAKKAADTIASAENLAVKANRAAADITIKSLNKSKVPKSIIKFAYEPGRVANVGKMAGITAMLGQERMFVENKFNPYIVAGEQEMQEQQSVITNIIKDLVFGSAVGIASPTLKGTAYAAMAPLTMSFINDPKDPAQALIDGIVYGTMHGMAAKKNPNFNNMKMFGGKKSMDPYSVAYNKAVDVASYEMFRSYDNTLPKLDLGKTVPTKFKNQETIQKMLDNSINKVYELLFFGKEHPTIKSAADLKSVYKNLDTKMDSLESIKVKGLNRLSRTAKKEATAKNKKIESYVYEEYGKDFGERGSNDVTLRTATTEIKRLTVAARQLYKGSLPDALRQKADLNDLMSFKKEYLEKRFEQQESFINPPRNKDIVELFGDEFLTKSYNNELPNPNTGNLNKTVALTGFAATKTNIAKAKEYMGKVANGTASKTLIVGKRGDLEPILNIKNGMIKAEDIKSGLHAVDPAPDKALQVFGVTFERSPEGKIINKELVELGWVATEHRRQTGKYAFNNQKLVKEGKIPPIEANNIQIFDNMTKNNVDYIIMNLDPMSTIATKKGYPFLVGNMRESNWMKSIELNKALSSKKNTNPVSMDIANYKKTTNAKEKTRLIHDIKSKMPETAVDFIPKKQVNEKVTKDSINFDVIQETTRESINAMKSSLDVASPKQVKEMFKENFDIILTKEESQDFFNRRETIELRELTNSLIEASKTNNASAATKIKADLMQKYLRSGVVDGMILDMPVVGKSKFTGVEDAPINGKSDYIEPVNPVAGVATEGTTGNATVSKILSAASAKIPNKSGLGKEPGPVTSRMASPEELATLNTNRKSKHGTAANEMIIRAKKMIEETNPAGGGKYEPIDVETGVYKAGRGAENVAKNLVENIKRLEPAGVSKIESVLIKNEVEPQLINTVALRLSEIFSMPIKDSQALVDSIYNRTSKTVKKTEIAPKSKRSFIEKDPLTKVSGYDILKNKRLKAGEDLVKWAKTGTEKNKPGTYSHSFSHTLDGWLTESFGKNYSSNTAVKELLGRAFGNEGVAKGLFKSYFETANPKKELIDYSQNKEFLNALATGDIKAREKAISKALNKTINKDTVFTDNDLATIKKLGYNVEGGNLTGMGVKTGKQIETLEGLSKADFQLLPGVTSIEMAGAKNTGPSAVKRGVEDARNIAQFIMKAHNESVANAKSFNGKVSKMNQKKLSFDLKDYKGTLKEKTDSLFGDIYKKYMGRLERQGFKQKKASEISKEITVNKNKLKQLETALKDPEERSNWQTPEILKDNITSVRANLERALKLIKETTKQDGTGGPGYDGRGGWRENIGNFFSNPIESIRTGWRELNKPKRIQLINQSEQAPTPKVENTQPYGPLPFFGPKEPKPKIEAPDRSGPAPWGGQKHEYIPQKIDGSGEYKPRYDNPAEKNQEKDSSTYQSSFWNPRKIPEPVKGTNYDPYDPSQNRPGSSQEDIGKGAIGLKIDESMVASSRKPENESNFINGERYSLPKYEYGTVLYVPELNKKYLVADLKGPRSFGENEIDFATPYRGKEVDPSFNKNFSMVILREGKGREDTLNFVNSGEWDKLKNTPVELPSDFI